MTHSICSHSAVEIGCSLAAMAAVEHTAAVRTVPQLFPSLAPNASNQTMSPQSSSNHFQPPDSHLSSLAPAAAQSNTAVHTHLPPALPALASLSAPHLPPASMPAALKPRGIGKDVLFSLLRRLNKSNRPLHNADILLSRLTHLQLDDARLTHIPAIDADERGWLALCSGVQVVYLHNNCIRRLEGLQWASHVTHLYLSHNRLERMAGLSHMHKLDKLYLSHNCISQLEALSSADDSLASPTASPAEQQAHIPLTELHLASQELAVGSAGLTFSAASLQSIAPTLTFLDVSSTRLSDAALASLSPLYQLSTLLAANNQLASLPSLLALLPSLPRLATLRLDDNALTRVKTYRASVVRDGRSIRELDGKDVRPEERQWLYGLEQQRRRASGAKRSKEANNSNREAKDNDSVDEWKRAAATEDEDVGIVIVGSRQGSREGRKGSGGVVLTGVVGVSAGHSRTGSLGDALPTAGIGLSAHHSRHNSQTK